MKFWHNCRGFFLIEVLISIMILSIAIASIAQPLIGALQSMRISITKMTAVHLAQEKLEDLKYDIEKRNPSLVSWSNASYPYCMTESALLAYWMEKPFTRKTEVQIIEQTASTLLLQVEVSVQAEGFAEAATLSSFCLYPVKDRNFL